MGHLVNSARIVYGLPIFCTLTPSERHGGLALRLFRGWQNDPAFDGKLNLEIDAFRECMGFDTPSLGIPASLDSSGQMIRCLFDLCHHSHLAWLG